MIGISDIHVGQEGRFKSQALLDEAGLLTDVLQRLAEVFEAAVAPCRDGFDQKYQLLPPLHHHRAIRCFTHGDRQRDRQAS